MRHNVPAHCKNIEEVPLAVIWRVYFLSRFQGDDNGLWTLNMTHSISHLTYLKQLGKYIYNRKSKQKTLWKYSLFHSSALLGLLHNSLFFFSYVCNHYKRLHILHRLQSLSPCSLLWAIEYHRFELTFSPCTWQLVYEQLTGTQGAQMFCWTSSACLSSVSKWDKWIVGQGDCRGVQNISRLFLLLSVTHWIRWQSVITEDTTLWLGT